MQTNFKRFMLASCLGVSVALVGLTGCRTATADRTAGRIHDDQAVTKTVEKNLKEAPDFKFPDVHVQTFDGVVQLSGFVDREDQLRRATEIASRSEGVHKVVNSLTLKPNPAPLVPTGASSGTWRRDATTTPPAATQPAAPVTTTPANTSSPQIQDSGTQQQQQQQPQ